MHRTQAFQFELDAVVDVKADVVVQAGLQLFGTAELAEMEELGLQGSEEAFHRCVIQVVSSSRHALRDRAGVKVTAIFCHSILGGFNRLSQHLQSTRCYGKTCGVDAEVDGARGDALARCSFASA